MTTAHARAYLAPLLVIAMLCAAAAASLIALPVSASEDVTSLRTFVAAQAGLPATPSIPRSAFLQQPSIVEVRLSPDGSQLAWLRERGARREVWMRTANGGTPTRLLSDTSALSLDWSRDGRWLLLQTPTEVFALATAGQADSGVLTTLGGPSRRQVLSLDVAPAGLLVVEEHRDVDAATPSQWQLWRVDARGQRTRLHQDHRRIIAALLDGDGQLAWLQLLEGGTVGIHRVHKGQLQRLAQCTPTRRCSLLARAPDGGVWLRSQLEGDLAGLQRLDGDGRLHTVHADPAGVADLGPVTLDPVTRQPLLVGYRSVVPSLHAVAPDAAPQLDALRQALPDRDLDLQVGRGAHARWLVRERGASMQGTRWHMYDPGTHALALLFDDAPVDPRSAKPAERIDDRQLARTFPVSWLASDGMRLHGFLTLPTGRPAASLPLVVNVHGGPWNHFGPEFRTIPQLLANRGYAVFEPNFRASTGHGRRYVVAADGDFGNGRVQQDIVEGTRWLLDHGIGDRQRVGIVGASFGGYSTLLGLTFQPDLFKVGVAAVPPPDFAWVLRWIARNPEAMEIGSVISMEDWLRAMQLDPADAGAMARLHAQSPLANVARMDRPLLMIAGGSDQRVGIAGVIEYAARLKLAGKDASLLVDAQAGHAGGDAVAREAYLYLLESMLHTHLHGAAPAPPDTAVADYVGRNLRLAGPSAPQVAGNPGPTGQAR